ncbi:MAG: fibronectin type III domain-containing protein [Candidatus Buchananbacteria bacterium]
MKKSKFLIIAIFCLASLFLGRSLFADNAPTDLKAEIVSADRILLTWKLSADTVFGYSIETKKDDGSYTVVSVFSYPSVISALVPYQSSDQGKRLTFRIRSQASQNDYSSYSNEASVQIMALNSLALPDLVISSLKTETNKIFSKIPFSVITCIKNIGAGNAYGPFDLYLDFGDGQAIRKTAGIYERDKLLKPGSELCLTSKFDESFGVSSLNFLKYDRPGNFNLTATTDRGNTVLEADDSNNSKSIALEVLDKKDTVAPVAPNKIVITYSKNYVDIGWFYPAIADLKSIYVYRSDKKGDLGWPVYKFNVPSTKASGSYVQDKNLNEKKGYYYVVKTVDFSGNESQNNNQYFVPPRENFVLGSTGTAQLVVNKAPLYNPALSWSENEKNLFSQADSKLVAKFKGSLMIQYQEHGEAWYLSATTGKKYYLAKSCFLSTFKSLAVGISNTDLNKIPIGVLNSKKFTNACKNTKFINNVKGKIFLQVQSRGEIWYVNPINCNRYNLKDEATALNVFKALAKGVSNIDLRKIPVGDISSCK